MSARKRSIKHEVVKLLEGGQELIPIDLTMRVAKQSGGGGRHRVSYETMRGMIEELITAHGYYSEEQ